MVSQNGPPDCGPDVRDAVSKYLYFMAFVKSVSSETLRAYASDLAQAFGLKSYEIGPKAIENGVRVGQPPRIPDSVLLTQCRAALAAWTHLAPATRNRKTACLKSFLNWMHDERAIDRDLAVHLVAPRAPVRLPHHLSVDEVISLLKSMDRDQAAADSEATRLVCIRDRALILLLYGGGLRVSEACHLRWTEVEGGGKLLRVLGKGSQERIVALPDLVTQALRALSRRSEFVFGEAGLSTRTAYEIVRTRGIRCGLLQPLHPHALRHSYATHLLSSGANLRTLQELLGHRSLQATQRYTHLGLDQLANTLEEFHPFGSEQKKPSD